MKKIITKADIRAHLEREMTRFLDKGGRVEEIPRGLSGHENGQSMMLPSRRLFIEPSLERTPIPEVVAAIEARRKSALKRTPAPKRNRRPQRRQKTIYDDFGEPLRRVWVDD
ncbi:MAG: hypothetical protein IMF06_12700 [Proteobacteria bacterium]|nr:hypothetical protein [Pseudomonadota bacterium]